MILPAHDPIFSIYDPIVGEALCAGRALALDFQHPGSVPMTVTLWVEGLDDYRGSGPFYRISFVPGPGHCPSFIYWPSVLNHLGQLALRASWRIVDRQEVTS